MSKEVLNTYTEVDPGTVLSQTATRSTFTDMDRDVDVYLYDDKGVNHFSGDFEHLIDVYITSTAASCNAGLWALTNLLDDTYGIKASSGDHLAFIADNVQLYIAECDGGTVYLSSLYPKSNGVTYYVRIKRDESVGTYGTLYCDIYSSDEDRANEENALANLSISLHSSKKDFRYIHCPISNNAGSSGKNCSGYCENLDLQEIQTIQPSSIASQESFGIPTLRYNQAIFPTSIPSAESFGTPLVAYPQYISPDSIPSAESVGTPFVCHYTGVTSKAIAACSYGSKVFLFRLSPSGYLYRRESTDYGVSWGSWIEMGAYSASGRLACCFKSSTKAILLYSVGSLLYVQTWNGSSWSGSSYWTNSLNSITGIAVTYMGDWNVVVTGTDTSNRPGVWTCVYGDGYSASVGTWTELKSLMLAEYGSGISYHFPSLDMPDVFRIFFIESYSGSEAYSMPFFTYSLPTADFIENLWREPVPFNLSSQYGVNMAHYTGSVFLSCPFGLWSADLAPEDVDLTADLREVHLSLKPYAGTLELTLRNDDGRYNAPSFTRGCDIRLKFGYHTPAGAETAGYLPIITIDSIERTLKKGRSEVIIHALDGWSLLSNWIARYQYSWEAGDKNVYQLLSFIFARAGVQLSAYSTSSRVTDFYPSFTIHPGERGITAVKRLLSLVEDVILFVGDVAYLLHPQSSDSADYAYGTAHKVTECVMFENTLSKNMALTHSEGIAVGGYRWSEIEKVFDRLSKEFDDEIETAEDASNFAEAILREAELEKVAGSIIVPMNCAHDMYDVIELTIPHLAISSQLYRLVAIDYYWIPNKGTYNQRLLLSVI